MNNQRNKHSIYEAQDSELYWQEIHVSQKENLKNQNNTAGHVNPEKPILEKIGTVYPQPVLW